MASSQLSAKAAGAAARPDESSLSSRPPLQIPERPIPPNPSLLALFLVTRSGSGPRVVAHYPATPSLRTQHADVTVADGYVSEAGSNEGDESGEENDDDTTDGSSASGDGESQHGLSSMSSPSRSYSEGGYGFYDTVDDVAEQAERKKPRREEKKSGWELLFGYGTDSLAKLMSPNSQSWHMNRFEVHMGGRTFVGCPAFRFGEGKWRRPKTPKTSEMSASGKIQVPAEVWDQAGDVSGQIQSQSHGSPSVLCPVDDDDDDDTESEVTNTPETATADKLSMPDASHDHTASGVEVFSSSTPSNYSAASSSNSSSSLTMFNVVAVVAPPSLEHQLRVEEHFQFVVKPLCVTLKRLQRKEAYLETQTRLLDKAMGEARERGLSYEEAWQRVGVVSPLANTLRTAFDSLSASKVAHLSLKTLSSVDVSIQIPLPTSTPFAPSPMTTQIPGIALSSSVLTASGPSTINTPLTTVDSISPHAALLVLHDNPEVLASQLASSPLTSSHGMAGPMSYFIRNTSPRKTLLQLSRIHHVPLNHMRLLATLLIRWRYARPITPLHAGNAYIVSANADWNKLQRARQAYAKRYPTLPEMVLILSKLSGTGRGANLVPWSSLIPSSDHKEAYMDVLAWLMRGGWVTQLRTFAWIRVSAAVKKAVAEQRRHEIDEMARAEHLESAVEDSHTDLDELSGFGTPQRRPSSGEDGLLAPAVAPGFLPHHFRSHLLSSQRPVSEAGSTGSNRTTFRIPPAESQGTQQQQHVGHDRHQRSGDSHRAPSEPASQATRQKTNASGSTRHRLERRTSLELLEADVNEPTIILEPGRLNNTQASWVKHIRQSFQDERLSAAWPRLIKYFDGRHALQDIAVGEGWKRKAVTQLLTTLLKESDCLQIVRHW